MPCWLYSTRNWRTQKIFWQIPGFQLIKNEYEQNVKSNRCVPLLLAESWISAIEEPKLGVKSNRGANLADSWISGFKDPMLSKVTRASRALLADASNSADKEHENVHCYQNDSPKVYMKSASLKCVQYRHLLGRALRYLVPRKQSLIGIGWRKVRIYELKRHTEIRNDIS